MIFAALAPNRLSCHTKVQGEMVHMRLRGCVLGGAVMTAKTCGTNGGGSVQWMHIDTVPEMKCWSCPVPGVSRDKDGAERFTSLTSRLLGISRGGKGWGV